MKEREGDRPRDTYSYEERERERQDIKRQRQKDIHLDAETERERGKAVQDKILVQNVERKIVRVNLSKYWILSHIYWFNLASHKMGSNVTPNLKEIPPG